MKRLSPIAVALLLLNTASIVHSETVPVAYDVDVVVAGGGCGAVAAALAAKKEGASVFLLTPYNYLGEDVAGTMQLWLEPDERPVGPLATALFNDPRSVFDPGLPFSYTASLPTPDRRHPDTKPPSRLSRTRPALDPQEDSVQYDGDVTITADLKEPCRPKSLELVCFSRPGDFEVASVTVDLSDDGENWTSIGKFTFTTAAGRSTCNIAIDRQTQFAKMTFKRAAKAERLLLGSIKFTSPAPKRPAGITNVSPLHAKTTLEQALQDAGVPFLFGCYATELLVDEAGRPAGIVMANRMGRQAVRAKTIIDATEHAVVAELAGAKFVKPDTDPVTVRWVSIASEPISGDGISVRKLPFPVRVFTLTARGQSRREAAWYEYTFTAERPADNCAAYARWEQSLRSRIALPSQIFPADKPIVPPVRSIRSRANADVNLASASSLDFCRPAGVDRLLVLSGCVDAPRDVVAKTVRPVAIMQLGERVGAAAAREAAHSQTSGNVNVADHPVTGAVFRGTVREHLSGLRSSQVCGQVATSTAALPVIGKYDVVVVGGGTSGAPAAIAAAREGAKTLVLEALHGLGGVGTLGMIGKYWYGNRVGFAAEAPQNPLEVRAEYYRSELIEAGGDVWFGVIGCGATVDGNRVTGVVVATPFGRGVITANVVIDGTGNAEIAEVAGAETRFVEDFFALQASHIPPREVGASYINGNRAPIDAADPLDVTAAMTSVNGESFDRGQLIASRERMRIVGDYCLDWLDQVTLRTFPDSIALGQSNYDSHGYQVHPYFMLKLRPTRVPGGHNRQFYSYVPYRCLLPRGLDGILVVGLGLSVHRDALPIVRMQPDLQNIGYAAGVAAAMAARQDTTPRKIDVKQLQARLVQAEILKPDVPAHSDSGIASDETLAAAVANVGDQYRDLAIVMANSERALPLLRKAYDESEGAKKLAYAQVLGVLRDPHGAKLLIAEAERRLAEDDLSAENAGDGKDPVVQLIWALGRTGDASVVPVLCKLADEAGRSNSERFRAAAVSLGQCRDARAVPVLRTFVEERGGKDTADAAIAACALYRCGDPDGAAKQVLNRMANGENGPLARLADQVFAE